MIVRKGMCSSALLFGECTQGEMLDFSEVLSMTSRDLFGPYASQGYITIEIYLSCDIQLLSAYIRRCGSRVIFLDREGLAVQSYRGWSLGVG